MKKLLALIFLFSGICLADPSCLLSVNDSNSKWLPPSLFSGEKLRYLNLLKMNEFYTCGFAIRNGSGIIACAQAKNATFDAFTSNLPIEQVEGHSKNSIFLMKDNYWVHISVSCRSK
jgi:hypothetical protein